MIPLRDYRPSGAFPMVTVALIMLNALVYLFETTLGGSMDSSCSRLAGSFITQHDCFFYQYGIVPHWLTGAWIDSSLVAPLPLWATIFTSMFVHANLFHVASNMWFLWIFGDNVENALGPLGFFVFYVFSGLAAAAAQVFSSVDSYAPMIGASGAIAGVLGAYLVLFPWGRIRTLIFLFIFIQIIDLPALLFLGVWFLQQLLIPQGGVATMAHVGGFVAGALVALALKHRILPQASIGP